VLLLVRQKRESKTLQRRVSLVALLRRIRVTAWGVGTVRQVELDAMRCGT
jgi:hypothetical protein